MRHSTHMSFLLNSRSKEINNQRAMIHARHSAQDTVDTAYSTFMCNSGTINSFGQTQCVPSGVMIHLISLLDKS
uniref:Uncharacterized protein n=1 Tax=Anguilla anguilla TaxID=7936 RepID=A0A0E9WJY8_ANGAN